MQSWLKKQIKKNSNIKKKQKLLENSTITIIMALMLLIPLLILFFASFSIHTDEYGIVLTIFSLFVTYSFEIYEWIYLFKKDKSKKHELLPSVYSFVLLIVFSAFGYNAFNVSKYIDWNNSICAGSLVIYLILITIRKIILDNQKLKK